MEGVQQPREAKKGFTKKTMPEQSQADLPNRKHDSPHRRNSRAKTLKGGLSQLLPFNCKYIKILNEKLSEVTFPN